MHDTSFVAASLDGGASFCRLACEIAARHFEDEHIRAEYHAGRLSLNEYSAHMQRSAAHLAMLIHCVTAVIPRGVPVRTRTTQPDLRRVI